MVYWLVPVMVVYLGKGKAFALVSQLVAYLVGLLALRSSEKMKVGKKVERWVGRTDFVKVVT